MTVDKKRKILVIYTHPTCEPCKDLKKTIDGVIEKNKIDNVDVVLVDISKNKDTGVDTVPRVCLINVDYGKCDGVMNCVEGNSDENAKKIVRFITGDEK